MVPRVQMSMKTKTGHKQQSKLFSAYWVIGWRRVTRESRHRNILTLLWFKTIFIHNFVVGFYFCLKKTVAINRYRSLLMVLIRKLKQTMTCCLSHRDSEPYSGNSPPFLSSAPATLIQLTSTGKLLV